LSACHFGNATENKSNQSIITIKQMYTCNFESPTFVGKLSKRKNILRRYISVDSKYIYIYIYEHDGHFM